MKIHRIAAELKRRGVTRAAAFYAAGAWGLLQIADIVFPLLEFPDWSVTLVLYATALGFPLVMLLTWIYDFSPEGLQATAAVAEDSKLPPLSGRRLLELTFIVTLVLIVGYLYLDRISLQQRYADELRELEAQRKNPEASLNRDKSVAVLPFTNMSIDPADAYFADGLSEEILNLLAKVGELKIAARTSSFQYREKETDIKEVAQALGVRHVLEGSVRRSGDRIRVTAQFIDADSGFHLWSETYDREMQDIFAIQDDIARQVVDALQVILSAGAGSTLASQSTRNLDAYQFYLQARDYLRRPRSTENLDHALAFYEKALQYDPEFAQAYAGLCDAYLAYFDRQREQRYFEEAERNCYRALTRDSNAVDVYVSLGNLYNHSGQSAKAAEQFERAVVLAPNLMLAHLGLARSYELQQKNRKAEAAYIHAIELQPGAWLPQSEFGEFLINTGRTEEAIVYFERVAQLNPDNPDALNNIGVALYMMEKYEQAAESFSRSLELQPTVFGYSNTGTAYYNLGRFDDAAKMYEMALELSPEDFELWGNLGDAYLASGHSPELSISSYERAIELASGHLRINPSSLDTMAMMAHYYAASGQSENAQDWVSRVRAAAGFDDMYIEYSLATAHAWLGQSGQALAALKNAISLGYSSQLAARDPAFYKLRELPEFDSLVALHENQTKPERKPTGKSP